MNGYKLTITDEKSGETVYERGGIPRQVVDSIAAFLLANSDAILAASAAARTAKATSELVNALRAFGNPRGRR